MIVKCWYCNVKDTDKKDMEVVERIYESGNKKNEHYHKDCYPKYLVKQQFIDQELSELDDLVEVIKDVHKIEKIPQQFYPIVQDLRNGTVIMGKKKKKYKKGFPYPLIAKTYLYCRENIEYWKRNKDFESTMGELKYCWAIINDKIDVVKRKEEKKEHQKAIAVAKEKEEKKNNVVTQTNKVVEFKKQKRNDDISDFL